MSESPRLQAARAETAAFRALQARREAARPFDLFAEPTPEPEPTVDTWTESESATEAWKQHALEVVERTARGRASFTVADVLPQLDETYDTRAVGAVLLTAARKRWIVSDGWTSGGASRHGRPVRVWRSRLFTESAA